jgi:hypothetical protein
MHPNNKPGFPACQELVPVSNALAVGNAVAVRIAGCVTSAKNETDEINNIRDIHGRVAVDVPCLHWLGRRSVVEDEADHPDDVGDIHDVVAVGFTADVTKVKNNGAAVVRTCFRNFSGDLTTPSASTNT